MLNGNVWHEKVEGYFLHKPNLNTKHSLSIENIFILVPTWVVNKSILKEVLMLILVNILSFLLSLRKIFQ
jgi:hypothetical protein